MKQTGWKHGRCVISTRSSEHHVSQIPATSFSGLRCLEGGGLQEPAVCPPIPGLCRAIWRLFNVIDTELGARLSLPVSLLLGGDLGSCSPRSEIRHWEEKRRGSGPDKQLLKMMTVGGLKAFLYAGTAPKRAGNKCVVHLFHTCKCFSRYFKLYCKNLGFRCTYTVQPVESRWSAPVSASEKKRTTKKKAFWDFFFFFFSCLMINYHPLGHLISLTLGSVSGFPVRYHRWRCKWDCQWCVTC